jgi:hypothetical protein
VAKSPSGRHAGADTVARNQDDTFARAKAAIDASRAELQRARGLVEQTEDLVNEANRVAGTPDPSSRDREKDGAS